MGLVAIWAAQVKSTPTVSVILQYSPKQVSAEYTILTQFRANQRNRKTNYHEVINDLIHNTERITETILRLIGKKKKYTCIKGIHFCL